LQVTKLRNEKGLVELEPYLVNGGKFAVQVWVNNKQKVFYPMPWIKEDIAAAQGSVIIGKSLACRTYAGRCRRQCIL
jgi:hypothetical protein